MHVLMNAEVDVLCTARRGERSVEWINQRNGYRARQLDTQVGTVELVIPKPREGSYLYFPEWLLDPRRRLECPLRKSWSDFRKVCRSTRETGSK